MHLTTTECEHSPEVALPQGTRLIEAGPVMAGDECGYAHRVVIAEFHGEFATWVAAYPDEDQPAFCYSGHYFRGIVDAAADFASRVERGF